MALCNRKCEKSKKMKHKYFQPILFSQWLDTISFMQDGAPSHIGLCLQQLLPQCFTNDRVICCAFPTTWQTHSPNLNPCDFWVSEHLKNHVYRGILVTLADIKQVSLCDWKASHSISFDPQLNNLSPHCRVYIFKNWNMLSSILIL